MFKLTGKKIITIYAHKISLSGSMKLVSMCSPFITLCLGSIEMDHDISEFCYKGINLQKHYRKMTTVIFFVKFHTVNIFRSHIMAVSK